MKIITVRINQVHKIPSHHGAQVTRIMVTEDGINEYELFVRHCARIPYYFEKTYKDLAVEDNQVYAATADSYDFADEMPICRGSQASPAIRAKLIALGVEVTVEEAL